MAIPKEKTGRIESKPDEPVAPTFAPDDPLDGREVGQWRSKYPPAARKDIGNEAIYLGGLLIFVPIVLIAKYTQVSSLIVFFLSACAIIPLAKYIGEATEEPPIHLHRQDGKGIVELR